MCHDYTGGHSSPLHGLHGGNGCTTDTDTCTVTTTTVDQRSFGYNSDNSSTNTNTSTYTIGDNWVRNLSKNPLTEAQECLLAHGPNFVLVPKDPPTCKYIVATEKACQHLMQGKAEELRGEIKSLLKKNHNIKPNIPKEEYQALNQMKKDNTRMGLAVDKGVSMVVLDREEYIHKSEELLHQPNYKILQSDPTNK